MTAAKRVKWALAWAALCSSAWVVLGFALYLALFHREFDSMATLLRGAGPGPRALLVPLVLLAVLLLFSLILKNKSLRLPPRWLLQFSASFMLLYLGFTLVHLFYADTHSGAATEQVPILLGGPCFSILLGVFCISAVLPLLNLLLHAHDMPIALCYVLHGGLLAVLLVALNQILYDKFASVGYALLFLAAYTLLYSVFALVHHALCIKKEEQSEKEYQSIYQ